MHKQHHMKKGIIICMIDRVEIDAANTELLFSECFINDTKACYFVIKHEVK